jgi:hypothetical protein
MRKQQSSMKKALKYRNNLCFLFWETARDFHCARFSSEDAEEHRLCWARTFKELKNVTQGIWGFLECGVEINPLSYTVANYLEETRVATIKVEKLGRWNFGWTIDYQSHNKNVLKRKRGPIKSSIVLPPVELRDFPKPLFRKF